MMKQEFEKLAGLQISDEEYRSIEVVYLYSDVDKFEFAKLWKTMNRDRVKEAKEEQKAKEEAARRDERLHNLAYVQALKIDEWAFYNEAFTASQIKDIKAAGIPVDKPMYLHPGYTIPRTAHEILGDICEHLCRM